MVLARARFMQRFWKRCMNAGTVPCASRSIPLIDPLS